MVEAFLLIILGPFYTEVKTEFRVNSKKSKSQKPSVFAFRVNKTPKTSEFEDEIQMVEKVTI